MSSCWRAITRCAISGVLRLAVKLRMRSLAVLPRPQSGRANCCKCCREPLDLLEQGQEHRKVLRTPLLERAGRVDDLRDDFGIRVEDLAEVVGLLPFTRQGDVAHLHRQGLREQLHPVFDLAPAIGIIPQKREDDPAVDALERFLHFLAGHDAAVVLAQDDVDRFAQVPDLQDGHHANAGHDHQQTAEAQHEFLPDAEHGSPP